MNTERKSRFLLACKVDQHTADIVSHAIIHLLDGIPAEKARGITPDRGREFAKHEEVSKAIHNISFYFADPDSPWQRGTNENTNGLLRECIPKGKDIAPVDPAFIAAFVNCLNHRPRKCLGWRSPFAVFFDTVLHLT